MSTDNPEANPEETTSLDELIEALETTHECFPIVGGMLGDRGETLNVLVAHYPAPIADFLDSSTHITHYNNSNQLPSVELPLETSREFQFRFDEGDPGLSIGLGAYLHVHDRKIPVRVVSVEMRFGSEVFDDHWIYRDERDIEV